MSAPAFPSLSSQLKLGIPKGSLEEATISLFDRAGWKIHKHVRNYFPDINDPEITARLCRVQEIPGYIRDGVLDLALTGKDWLLETGIPTEGLDCCGLGKDSAPAGSEAPARLVSNLIYSKVSNRPARWVLAVAGDSPYRSPADLRGNASPPNWKASPGVISTNWAFPCTSTTRGAPPRPRSWRVWPTPLWK